MASDVALFGRRYLTERGLAAIGSFATFFPVGDTIASFIIFLLDP